MKSIQLYGVYLICCFPLFFFTYKFADPEPLAHDFFQYYKLYFSLDIHNTIAPHNMRLAGAFFVNLFYKMNLYYDTETAFDKYQSWGFLKQVYFDAVFFNFLCVVVTCFVLFQTLRRDVVNTFLAFCGGMSYLLGFGTLFYCLMPLTEAFSILLFAVVYSLYLKKSYWIWVPLVVLVFQREYVFLALGLVAVVDLLTAKGAEERQARRSQRKIPISHEVAEGEAAQTCPPTHGPRFGRRGSQRGYYMLTLVSCIFLFTVYYILRKTVFYTPHLEFQSKPEYMLENLLRPQVEWGSYFKQLLMTLNLFIIYLGVIVFKYFQRLQIDKLGLIKLVLLLLQVNIVTIAGGHGNNVGRYFYLLVPVVIIGLIKEIEPILKNREHLPSVQPQRLR